MSENNSAVVAAPATQDEQRHERLNPKDGAAFMEVILYGQEAGWGKSSDKNILALKGIQRSAQHKLMCDVLASHQYNENNNTGEETAADAEEGSVAVVAPAMNENADLAPMKPLLVEAKKQSDVAEEALSRGLITCENWLELRDTFYNAGALFSVAGLPDDAARCLLNATFINRAFKDHDEAVVSLSLAVENMKLSHPTIAVESLTRLVDIYEKNKLHFQAGRCAKEAAEMCESRLDDKENAIVLYRRAIVLFEATANPYKAQRSFILACQERLCFLYGFLGMYEELEKLCLELAETTPRDLPATKYYLYATMAVLARGFGGEEAFFDSIYYTEKRFDYLQECDSGYQKGKENDFVRAVVAALKSNSLNAFDMAVRRYNEYKTTLPNAAFDLMMERIRENLFEHLEHYA